jgi:class 3 adenylate cyclase/tetratricopeptide (TPR) repeat protein
MNDFTAARQVASTAGNIVAMQPTDAHRDLPAQRQRHVLTVLFSDLVGSTKLGRDVDAELLADLIDQLRDIWRDAAHHHGGMVLRTQGDGALLVFGYPHPCEDGGRRAAEAAMEIHQRADALAGAPYLPRLPRMRSGIATGVVLVSPGDIERGRLDLVGDLANSAAGLLKFAQSGAIIAYAAALGPHANFFEHVPGPQPSTLSLLSRRAVQRRLDATAELGLTVLIDRDGPLVQLCAFLAHESGPCGPCMLLEAEAGMGKTRLLDEVIQRMRGTVLYGTCESYLAAEVLQPFAQMLRNRAPPAGLAFDANLPASPERLLDLFSGWSALEPLSLVVDDWQWADDASRQLVQGLLERAPRVVILLACRPRDDGARWIVGAPRVQLMPLSLAGTFRAVRQWQPNVDPFLVERIHAHTGGVPLYVEELCRSSSPLSLAQWLDGQAGTPSWLAAWVVGRLTRLPVHLADLVRAAAVAGNAVSVALLQSASGQVCDAEVVLALAEADFLYRSADSETLHFKHGLTRDAVYESIGLRDRQRLHAAYGTLLGQDARPGGQAEALAFHCRGAGQWQDAAAQAERSGDKASAAFALDSARKWYLTAMDALDRLPERGRDLSLNWCLLSNKLGMTCIFDPLAQGNDATPFESAVALARSLDDAAVLARCLYWLGYMYYGFGRFRQSEHQLRLSRDMADRAGDVRLAAQVDATLAQVLAAASRYDEALRLFDVALAAKQRQSKPGRSMAIGSAYSLACKGSVLADRGAFDAAHRCFDEALALLGGTTHPVANSARNWVAVALVWQGRWREAEQVAAESARIAENTRSLLLLVVCSAAAGYARWADSADPAGLAQAADAVNWMDARGGRFYSSLHHGWLVDAYSTLGDLTRARHHAAQVVWRSREGERLGEACAYRALARLALRDGDVVRASSWLDRAVRSADLRESRREAALNLAAEADLLRWQGNTAAAIDLTQQARSEFVAMGMRWHAQGLPSEG